MDKDLTKKSLPGKNKERSSNRTAASSTENSRPQVDSQESSVSGASSLQKGLDMVRHIAMGLTSSVKRVGEDIKGEVLEIGKEAAVKTHEITMEVAERTKQEPELMIKRDADKLVLAEVAGGFEKFTQDVKKDAKEMGKNIKEANKEAKEDMKEASKEAKTAMKEKMDSMKESKK